MEQTTKVNTTSLSTSAANTTLMPMDLESSSSHGKSSGSGSGGGGASYIAQLKRSLPILRPQPSSQQDEPPLPVPPTAPTIIDVTTSTWDGNAVELPARPLMSSYAESSSSSNHRHIHGNDHQDVENNHHHHSQEDGVDEDEIALRRALALSQLQDTNIGLSPSPAYVATAAENENKDGESLEEHYTDDRYRTTTSTTPSHWDVNRLQEGETNQEEADLAAALKLSLVQQ